MSKHTSGPVLGECLDHHNMLIFGEPVEPINAGTSELAAEIARRWNAYPDLLAACEKFLRLHTPNEKYPDDHGHVRAEEYEAFRAALRKARGE